jgi:sugar phosphate isomerase/epimerase
MKVGLYSITYLGAWYDGPALTVKEFIHKAKELGYDGIELDGKRPHGNPMDLSQQDRDEIREECEKVGLDIPAVASNNDFSSPVPEHRESQLLMVREQARLAADIGAGVLRLFAAWPGITFRDGGAFYREARQGWARAYPDVPGLERYRLVRECLKEAAEIGEEFGVVMALQNHAPLIDNYQHMLDLIREVDSPWLKACLDAPLLINQEGDWVRQAALATGDLQVHSHFGGEFLRDEDGMVQLKSLGVDRPPVNYSAFLNAMKDVGYDGYFCYEFCHPAVDENRERRGIDMVHEQAALALAYMRDRIAEVEG